MIMTVGAIGAVLPLMKIDSAVSAGIAIAEGALIIAGAALAGKGPNMQRNKNPLSFIHYL